MAGTGDAYGCCWCSSLGQAPAADTAALLKALVVGLHTPCGGPTPSPCVVHAPTAQQRGNKRIARGMHEIMAGAARRHNPVPPSTWSTCVHHQQPPAVQAPVRTRHTAPASAPHARHMQHALQQRGSGGAPHRWHPHT